MLILALDFLFFDIAIRIVYQERRGRLSLLKYGITLSMGGACDKKPVKSPRDYCRWIDQSQCTHLNLRTLMLCVTITLLMHNQAVQRKCH